MESRVERNRTYRKNKRRVRLFLILAVILLIFSLFQVNRSYADLVGDKEASQIIGFKKEDESMEIILLGEQIKISQDYINQSKKIIRDISHKISQLIKDIIQKASNH